MQYSITCASIFSSAIANTTESILERKRQNCSPTCTARVSYTRKVHRVHPRHLVSLEISRGTGNSSQFSCTCKVH
ncbi:uncharacterized protein CC84DRAFT_577203 [Paraphaeosphaeria sporulosa]|uniref:Uncharacterized protein n=1 Tax=Paraphaeosphaeria sporulosa TaxID=1460663 RepID=A0A177CMF5_9PLEO|nr:uncharacterized protein CC84DRAFT_577203 [Paraphaeosphaeria sporulosa]OAG08441.1 hypothetical protein CC84DRAFT_577203 [Paraphaeosphaeria sporulosa]